MTIQALLPPLLFLAATAQLSAAPRDIQIKSVDFQASVLELHNFGADPQSLTGWRFCSHDENQTRRYSSANGLNGLSIAAGASLFLHWLNDAPAAADHINITGRGNFAIPLDNGPYAIQIYFAPVTFTNGNTIADHLQWNIDGTDDVSADERSDEAQSGGVWTNQSLWVATAPSSARIDLTGDSSSALHGPLDYTPTETFQSWIKVQDLVPADQDPDDDPEGDGLTNFAEYGYDLDPSVFNQISDTALEFGAEEDGGSTYLYLDYTAHLQKTDLSYAGQRSTTLTAFESAGVEERVLSSSSNQERRRARIEITTTNPFAVLRLMLSGGG